MNLYKTIENFKDLLEKNSFRTNVITCYTLENNQNYGLFYKKQ